MGPGRLMTRCTGTHDWDRPATGGGADTATNRNGRTLLDRECIDQMFFDWRTSMVTSETPERHVARSRIVAKWLALSLASVCLLASGCGSDQPAGSPASNP